MAGTRTYRYALEVRWTGNTGEGTRTYTSYTRDYVIAEGAKPPLAGSSDPAFRGDPGRYNPEEMLLGALSACHMLWYLHLAAEAGTVVTDYTDRPTGTMEVGRGGIGRFTAATLRPRIVVAAGADLALADSLHGPAHQRCFIVNSINFPLEIAGEVSVAPSSAA